MSRRDREAWEAQLAADPALRTAWDGFAAQLSRFAATARPGTEWNEQTVAEAVAAILDSQQAGRAVDGAGLDPDQAAARIF